jgi:murein DD-endopeptidase MepM/ murein hydrolase activator NlpD
MLARLRTLRPAATRTALTGLLTLTVVTVPGSVAPVRAAEVPAYRVLAGTVLEPLPARWVLPVHSYRLTGRFGETSSLWHTVHTGLDFAAPTGTLIRSLGAGVVLSTGFDGRYGNKTVVRLVDGTEVWYCHQSAISVKPGQAVRVGEPIGYIGSTGNVTGPHLHLEIRPRPDRPVDPDPWLRARGLHP